MAGLIGGTHGWTNEWGGRGDSAQKCPFLAQNGGVGPSGCELTHQTKGVSRAAHLAGSGSPPICFLYAVGGEIRPK